jgi:predicted ester cyclase
MNEQENIQAARRRLALLNARDIDGYVQEFDESFVGEGELSPGGLRGRAALRNQVEMLLTAFPDARFEIEQVLTSGDYVVSRVRMTGTHKGPFARIAPTDKSVSQGVCGVYQVRDGKVIRGRVYADNASLFEKLGVLSIPRFTVAG